MSRLTLNEFRDLKHARIGTILALFRSGSPLLSVALHYDADFTTVTPDFVQ
jgi:hypothetical protein